jgi:hypothetical protein
MSEKKSQLHQILAVEGDLIGEAKRVEEEAIHTFGKSERFTGHTKTLKMLSDDRSCEESAGCEHIELTTTVAEKLDYIREAITRAWDCSMQKEKTNQIANADLVVDGNIIATKVPATALLGLETRLKELRRVVESIPTLQPGIKWEAHPEKQNVFVASDKEVKNKTEKVMEPVILYPATKEHAAQVKESTKDVVVGTFTIERVCGMISPTHKSILIGRVDTMLRAVKKARMEANCTEVEDGNIGKAIFDYILV